MIFSPATPGLLRRFASRYDEGAVANWLEGPGWLDICVGLVERGSASLSGLR